MHYGKQLTPLGINCYLQSINWFSTKEIPKVTTDPTASRAALIAGLHGLADFLEANPFLSLPLHVSAHISVPVPGTDEDEQLAA